MRALQSRTTAGLSSSGGWCRTEQFAALRYVSRHLETDVEVEQALKLPAIGSSFVEDVGLRAGQYEPAWVDVERLGAQASAEASPLARDAEELLQMIRFCNIMLADTTISFTEWTRYSKEMEFLRDRGWALMEQFLRTQERGETSAVRPRRIKLEESVAGWIASC